MDYKSELDLTFSKDIAQPHGHYAKALYKIKSASFNPFGMELEPNLFTSLGGETDSTTSISMEVTSGKAESIIGRKESGWHFPMSLIASIPLSSSPTLKCSLHSVAGGAREGETRECCFRSSRRWASG